MATKKNEKPKKKEQIKVGSVTLPFYPWTDPRTKQPGWRWAWKDSEGKWKYGTRVDKQDAAEAARARARTISNGKLDLDGITEGQAGLVRQFLALDPTEEDLENMRKWRAARSTTIKHVLDIWHSHKLAELSGKESAHLRIVYQWLEKLAQALPGPADRITAAELQAHIEAASSNGKSRKDGRARVAALWSFAGKQDIFHSTAPEKLPKYKADKRDTIEFWSPSEMTTLLKRCPSEFLPWLVLASFSGLRSEEICPKPGTKPPLRWEWIKRSQGVIDLPAKLSKVKKRRLVPITPTLEKWLNHINPPKTGIVCERLPAVYATNDLGATVGGWKKNALRHSYGSYRAADTKDLAAMAIEMGTSEKMIEDHYREAVEESIAAIYWSLAPSDVFRM